MGILDKLKFWKKGEEDFGDLGLGREDLGLGKDVTGLEGAGTARPGGMPGFGEMEHAEGAERPLGAAAEAPATQEVGAPGYSYGGPSPYAAPGPAPTPAAPGRHEQLMIGKELELISTKLDSLKITLDSMNMRIASLERIAKGEYEKTW